MEKVLITASSPGMVSSSFLPVEIIKVVFVLIVKKDSQGQTDSGTGHIDVRHIENREIDQREENKVPDIGKKDPVDHIAKSPRSDQDYKNSEKKVLSLHRRFD